MDIPGLVFHPATESPNGFTGGQYVVYAHWMDDERDAGYAPDFFIALWEDGRWWIRDSCHIEDEDITSEEGGILRPRFFRPLPDWYEVLGWAALFGS